MLQLIDTPVENPKVELACRQIVDCLVQHVIIFENERGIFSAYYSLSYLLCFGTKFHIVQYINEFKLRSISLPVDSSLNK